MQRLLALALVLQSVELLAVRRSAGDRGIWRWPDLDLPFGFVLRYRPFVALLCLRLIAAVATLFVPHPALYAFLFVASLLVSLRWRGSFNGGSDFMTLMLLSAATVATAFHGRPRVVSAALWYAAIVTCNSYFIAGVAKLRRESWRSGEALRGFLVQSMYQPPPRLLHRHARLASAAVLLLECIFPVVLLSPTACAVVLPMMLAFHLGNAWVFGLNRFVFAWAAAYPALLYASGRW